MLPTPRLLLLALIAAPLLAAALAGGAAPLIIAIFYLLALGGVLLTDRALTARPDQLDVERLHDQRLSIGASNPITILLANRSDQPLNLTLRDEFPDEIAADQRFLQASLPAFAVAEVRYYLLPRRRGDYQFGALVVRYPSRLGLFVRQVRFPLEATIKVYPNILEVRKYDLMARKGLLFELGLRQARTYGQGGEFERLRDYLPDDEFRRINWKATARKGKPIAAEYQTERSQYILTAIDAGRLMASPVGDPAEGVAVGLARLDYVINTSLLLSYVALLKGDHVGSLAFADQVGAYLAPKRGRGQFQRILEGLYNLQTQPVEADHSRALGFLGLKNRRRSLIVIFTDLTTLDAARPLIAALARLAKRHLPLCVTISDPEVRQHVGAAARSAPLAYRRAVAEMLVDERQVILDTLRQSGVLTIDVPADQLTVSVINTYLELKARGRL